MVLSDRVRKVEAEVGYTAIPVGSKHRYDVGGRGLRQLVRTTTAHYCTSGSLCFFTPNQMLPLT
jgi:hypothetical protein